MRTSAFAVFLLFGAGHLPAREYGPPIGHKMPDFKLADQDGKTRSLKSLLGAKGAVILVYRSADWCPYCKAQLTELEQHQDAFRQIGLRVAAISYDSPAALHHFAERKGIHFPLLSDPNSKLIRQLGILNETIPADSPFFGVPHPGSFVLDAMGVIRAKYFEEDYHQRYTSAGILLHQFGILPEEEKKEFVGKQLKVTATATNPVVSPGQRIVLAMDIELRPNAHVYAPGVESYIPIEWKMEDSNAALVQKAEFPAPQKLFLAAINETVPAYSGAFRVTRDITIEQPEKLRGAVDATGHFTLRSTLRYQACDDRICYIPQDLAVQWTFEYQELDAQRVPLELQHKAASASHP